MANRNFSELQGLPKEVKVVFAKASYNAGVFTLSQGQGVTSITRIGAGQYQILLQDRYMRLLNLSVISEATTENDHQFQIHSNLVNSSKTIDFVLQSVADPDLANGEIVHITMFLKNSSAE